MTDDTAPAWAHEPIRIVPHDEGWADRAAELIEQLEALLEPWLADAVHHIGSTAVDGLAAKPTIDLLAGLGELAAADEADGVLQEAGWRTLPRVDGDRIARRSYTLPDASGEHREAHLHLMAADDPDYRGHLAFRDHLRANPAVAARYVGVKRGLAAAHPDDREAYTTGKAAFIQQVLGEIGADQAESAGS